MIAELQHQVDRLAEIPEEFHQQLSTVLGFLLDCYIFEGVEGVLAVGVDRNLHVMSLDATTEEALRMAMAAARILADARTVADDATQLH